MQNYKFLLQVAASYPKYTELQYWCSIWDLAISGILVRNSYGTVMNGLTAKSFALSAFESKALAMLQALELADVLQVKHAIFEGDVLMLFWLLMM